MGVVMIKCPGTGRAIPTGMKADRERFRCSPVFFARTFCSICQTNHEWFAREAWVHEPEEKWRMHEPASPCNRRKDSRRGAAIRSMAPWPLAGRSLRRCAPPHFVRVGKQGDFSPRRWRLHLLRQDDTIDSAAHELVAFACRRFEPRSVNLDRAAGIGSDCARTREAWK